MIYRYTKSCLAILCWHYIIIKSFTIIPWFNLVTVQFAAVVKSLIYESLDSMKVYWNLLHHYDCCLTITVLRRMIDPIIIWQINKPDRVCITKYILTWYIAIIPSISISTGMILNFKNWDVCWRLGRNLWWLTTLVNEAEALNCKTTLSSVVWVYTLGLSLYRQQWEAACKLALCNRAMTEGPHTISYKLHSFEQ